MKIKLVMFFLIIMFLSCHARAQIQLINPWPVTENLASIEKVVQSVQAELSAADDEEKNADDKKKIEMRDPKADSAEVKENKGNPKSSEFPPYGDEKLRAELAKKRAVNSGS